MHVVSPFGKLAEVTLVGATVAATLDRLMAHACHTTDRTAGAAPTGENVAGERPEPEPATVTDEVTAHDGTVELERTIGLVGASPSASAR